MVEGNPAEGIPVFSHEVDGSYIVSLLTNASGEVTFDDFPAGGAVTAPVSPFIGEFSDEHQLTSITGVQLGDVLTLGNSRVFPGARLTPAIGNASIALPTAAIADATSYRIYIPCRRVSTDTVGETLSLSLHEECIKADNTIDAFAIAEDESGTRLAYTLKTAIPVTGVAPNLVASASLSGWKTDWARLRLNLQNAPFDDVEPEGLFQGYKDGLLIETENFSDIEEKLSMGEEGFFARNCVPNLIDDAAYLVGISSPSQAFSLIATRENLSLTSGSSITRSIDLTSDLLPAIENIEVTDFNDLAVTWTTADEGVACKGSPMPDSLITVVVGKSETEYYAWFVLSQGSASQKISYPKLDAALAASIWPISTLTDVQGGVAVFSDTARTWNEIRTTDSNMRYFDYSPTPDSTRCVALGGALGFN